MKLRITLEGKVYEVEVEVVDEGGAKPPGAPPSSVASPPASTPASAAAAPPAASAAPAPTVATDSRQCVSPLPGTVLKVLVKPGERVSINQTLMVLDAMKMETNIPSPADGTIKNVPVSPGDGVKQGDVLIEFE